MTTSADGECGAGEEIPDPAPLDELNQPPIDRFCDLVLTGGVTDGVVYPWAIVELAREYRFKNIGGTSVGAMAAALTAAAEYSRRYGSVAGFNEVLLKLPRKLGDAVNGKTKLFSLFQPAASTRRLFGLFVGFFSPDPSVFGKGRIQKYALPLLRAYQRPVWIGVVLGLLAGLGGAGIWLCWFAGPAYAPTWTAVAALVFELAVPCMLLCVLALVVIAVYCDLVDGLVENGFGLCNGNRVDGTPPEEQSLVEWLHEGIQGAAGKPLDQPLTFKDLWDAPDGPEQHRLRPPLQTKKPRSIDLRMVTTNLAHARPYGLPLDDETSRLFFTLEDLTPYFPDPVIKHLEAHSKPYAPAAAGDPDSAPGDILELPRGELPVVVAARLSLSFPVLFSTVPLWAIDYEPRRGERTLRRCRFSDGGICSDFPIHLFDAAIPEWPTFGISLSHDTIRTDRFVWVPKYHLQGRGDSWHRFDEEKAPLDRLTGFVSSIISSAKDWNDQTSMRMPGVRDRIAHVFLEAGEGALDLKLSAKNIMLLASKFGQPAGRALIEKFISGAPGGRPSGFWDEHRWVRFNTWLTGLRERIEGITAATERAGFGKPLKQQIAEAMEKRPLAGNDADDPAGAKLTPAQADDLRILLAALQDLELKFSQAQLPQPYKPVPTPSLRIRAPL